MKIIIGLLFFYIISFVFSIKNNLDLVVELSTGAIQGSIIKSRLGQNIYSFRGIRYAEAPIGRNRFKQASPVKRHNGIFDATEDGPSCPQPILHNRTISEDCLRLNVYNTTLSKYSFENSSLLRDVIVFIHPGAFYVFSGTTHDFGPQHLLDRNIILVTINYRLGALGFLSTGDSRAPGNAGLKDQVLALKWIQENIQNFGGNPNSVTLMGYSAGSWSISLHIVSPMSKGLFHRAIAMSGAVTNQNRLPIHQKYLAIKQAEILGCPIDTFDNIFNCLYTKSAEEFGNSLSKFAEFYGDPVLIFTPVIEKIYNDSDIKNNKPFLIAQPIDIIREKNANFVPLITGVNKDEFGGVLIIVEELAQSGNTTIYDDINEKWEKIAPISFLYERNTTKSINISCELKSFYLNDKQVGLNNYIGLSHLYADALIIFQEYRFERLMANYSSEPVYNYHYVYSGCNSFAKWSNGTNFGVVHHDELLLLFKMEIFPPLCTKDISILERMTEIVETFVKNGIPIINNNNLKNNWEQSTQNEPKYLRIDEQLSMVNGIIYENRVKKFEELFPMLPIEIIDSTQSDI